MATFADTHLRFYLMPSSRVERTKTNQAVIIWIHWFRLKDRIIVVLSTKTLTRADFIVVSSQFSLIRSLLFLLVVIFHLFVFGKSSHMFTHIYIYLALFFSLHISIHSSICNGIQNRKPNSSFCFPTADTLRSLP